MVQVNNFDPEEYKSLLEEFGKCRRGVTSTKFYEALTCITPSSYITSEMEYLLERWSNTNPSGSWGLCQKPAQKIHDLLLKKWKER